MSKLTPKHFKGMKMKTINNYIDTINTDLGEKLPLGASFNGAAKTLRDYLNSHDFINHEGIEINDDTIDDFITRINSENKNDNLNFLPTNKIDNEMTQAVNPLEQLVQNTISVNDLLQIYNRYSPNPITEQQLQQSTNGNLDLAKAQLINEILLHAKDGTLVTRGNGFGRTSDRKGMPDLAKIVLDLQRDIKRVKNAISPQGAQALVDKHNATAKPSAHWKLNKRNPQGPATLTNLTDINNDGIPDVIITNANNQPVYVNGYTTTNSNYPIDLAYYTKYPTRADRHGHSLNDFKNELYNVTYDVDNDDIRQRGNVTAFDPHVEYLDGYDLNKFKLKQPKRMTSFNRFKKFVVGLYIDRVLQELNVPSHAKLAVLSKACAAAWNTFVLAPIYHKYNANTEADRNRIKKKAAAEIDLMVDDVYYRLTQTNDNWSEQNRAGFENQFIETLGNAIGGDFEGHEFV